MWFFAGTNGIISVSVGNAANWYYAYRYMMGSAVLYLVYGATECLRIPDGLQHRDE